MKRMLPVLVLVAAVAGGFRPGLAAPNFGSTTHYPTLGSTPSSVIAADFDGDGLSDLAVGTNAPSVEITLQGPTGAFSAPTSVDTLGAVPLELATADVDGDGRRDLVAVVRDSNGNLDLVTWIGNGDGTFEPMQSVTATAGLGAIGASSTADLAIADLDADGRSDVVVVTNAFASMFEALGSPAGLAYPTTITTAAPATDVALGSIGDDALVDAVLATGSGAVLMQRTGLGFGPGVFLPQNAPSAPSSAVIADMNADGKADVVTGNFSIDGQGFTVSVLLGAGNGTFGNPHTTTSSTGNLGSTEVGVADFDLDGKMDLVATTPTWFQARFMDGNGAGGFTTNYGYPIQEGPVAVITGDLDADGKPDAVVVNGLSKSVTVMLQASPPTSAPNFVQVQRGHGQLTITWMPPNDATGYKIYRSFSPSPGSLVASIGSVTSYTDTGLGDGVTAYYQVSATNSHGEGPRSTVTAGTTFSVPGEPRNVVADQGFGTIGGVRVSWQSPLEDGGGPISYRVCKRSSPTGPETCANTNNSFFQDSGNIPILGTYYYTVSAFNVVGAGPASPTVCSRAFPTPPVLGLDDC